MRRLETTQDLVTQQCHGLPAVSSPTITHTLAVSSIRGAQPRAPPGCGGPWSQLSPGLGVDDPLHGVSGHTFWASVSRAADAETLLWAAACSVKLSHCLPGRAPSGAVTVLVPQLGSERGLRAFCTVQGLWWGEGCSLCFLVLHFLNSTQIHYLCTQGPQPSMAR